MSSSLSSMHMHDLGDAHFSPSISIERDRADRTLKVSRKRLTAQLVKNLGFRD